MSFIVFIGLQLTVIAMAFVGGALLAFSDFIMRSLAKTSGAGGLEAMQSINREVFRWIFMALFLGLVPVSIAMIAYGFLAKGETWLIAFSGLVYLLGCFGVTALRNVPLNETLANMEPSAAASQAYWTGTYLPRWTFWNSLRALSCAASALLLLMGLSPA